MMLLRSGAFSEIFNEYKDNVDVLKKRDGGDQVWVGPKLNDVYYLDDDFPLLKRNLKFHLAEVTEQGYGLPSVLPAGVKMVDCGGRPKPHELLGLRYVHDSWHLVPPVLKSY